MTPERWQQIDRLLDAALALASEERATFLDGECSGDAALRREVESLLGHAACVDGFIESSPAATALAEHERARLTPGARVGRYEVVSRLAAGGMGEIYLADDLRLRRRVALKLLPEELAEDRERRARFEREAYTASALNHPNVCVVHDVGEADDGRHFIAMEFVDGVTLRERLEGGALPLAEALAIAKQVSSALAAAHEAGIVHRDIKPENLMLRHDGLVKVLDFGLAKLAERPTSDSAPSQPRVTTSAGMVLGTPRYMSPEQARGLGVDARTDIWSLGVVLYEMVTGQAPFVGSTTSDVLVSVLEREPAPLSRFVADAPAELERVVTKTLRKQPDERYQTVTGLLSDLKRIELAYEAKVEAESSPSQDTHSATTASLADAARAARATGRVGRLTDAIARRRRGAVFALVALVVAVAGVGYAAYHVGQGARAQPPLPPQRALARLTFDAGLQAEPTWSPDGRFIAFSSDKSGNSDIWVQSVAGGDPVQVTHASEKDWQPDWSPDGSQIAFRSEREGGGLFVVPALGGRERKISKFGYYPKWSPDGNRILFSDSRQDKGGATKVYVMSLDGNPPREVLSEFLADFDKFNSLIWHPDGQRISLWGRRRHADWGLWTLPLAGGTPVRSELDADVERSFNEQFGVRFGDPSPEVGVCDTFTFRWAPSGRALYFKGLFQGVSSLWKFPVDPQTLRWVAPPERLTTGIDDTDVAVSPDGRRLAFTERNQVIRAWALPFDARTGKVAGEGQPVTPIGRLPLDFSLSSDGKHLSYCTPVTGTKRWEFHVVSMVDGQDRLLLEIHGSGAWSKDGTRLATTIVASSDGADIVVMPAGGGDQQIIAGGAPDGVSDWSADGQWLLATTDRMSPGRFSTLALYPLTAAPHAETQMRVLASSAEGGLWNAYFSPNGRWVCFNEAKLDGSVIYVIPSSGGEWIRITETDGWSDKPHWSPDGKTIYFVSKCGTGWWNVWGIRFDPQQGKPVGDPFQVTSLDSPSRMVWPDIGSMQISLSTDRLVLPLTEATGNIWVLDGVDR